MTATIVKADGSAQNLQEAVEVVESHLHPRPSWDVADHPMPTGREEIWRFTPVSRLKALLDGTPSEAHLLREESLPTGVTSRDLSEEEARTISAEAPGDRVSVLAAALSGGAHLVDVPADAAPILGSLPQRAREALTKYPPNDQAHVRREQPKT